MNAIAGRQINSVNPSTVRKVRAEAASPDPARITAQNTRPIRATTVRGCRKCVPLKVERKL